MSHEARDMTVEARQNRLAGQSQGGQAAELPARPAGLG